MTKKERNDEGKDAEWPDETSPDDMEEGVSDKNIIIMKKMSRKKMHNAMITLILLGRCKWDKWWQEWSIGWGERGRMTRWHFPWWDVGRCMW